MSKLYKILILGPLVMSCIGATYDGDMCLIEKAVIHNMQPGGVVNPPKIDRVAIEDNYAIAAWAHGYAGGIAELQHKSGAWIILSNGGGWQSTQGLIKDGIPKKTAEKLAKDFGMK